MQGQICWEWFVARTTGRGLICAYIPVCVGQRGQQDDHTATGIAERGQIRECLNILIPVYYARQTRFVSNEYATNGRMIGKRLLMTRKMRLRPRFSSFPVAERGHTAALIGRSPLMAALAAILVGLAGGAVVAFAPFWLGFAALAALAAVYAILVDTRVGLATVIGIATIVPFATLPFRAVITPTLLTLALAALMGVWILRMLVRGDQRVTITPIGMALIGFLGITLFAFLLGSNASPEPSLLHNYVKFAMAMPTSRRRLRVQRPTGWKRPPRIAAMARSLHLRHRCGARG